MQESLVSWLCGCGSDRIESGTELEASSASEILTHLAAGKCPIVSQVQFGELLL